MDYEVFLLTRMKEAYDKLMKIIERKEFNEALKEVRQISAKNFYIKKIIDENNA